MGQPRPLFRSFSSFLNKYLVASGIRRKRWPLDHRHGPWNDSYLVRTYLGPIKIISFRISSVEHCWTQSYLDWRSPWSSLSCWQGFNSSHDFFLFPYIALISAFAAQMALLGFIFLSFSPGMCHLMVEDYSRACERKRDKKKQEEEEKSPEKTTSPWLGFEPTDSVSRAEHAILFLPSVPSIFRESCFQQAESQDPATRAITSAYIV